ncbi:hypothetical protein LCGC14_3034190 [marine sediment metagenome]|uniref:Uncharacterized protein n=1 Tax=marine sediment metagenome TaxID=412755 RepID=A0A0F8YZG4_9ZZZZ
MFEILLDEVFKKIVGYIPIPEHDLRKVAKAEQKNTLKQVIELEAKLRAMYPDGSSFSLMTLLLQALQKEAEGG